MPDRIVPSLNVLNDLLIEEQRLRREDIQTREKFRRQQRWKNILGAVLLLAVGLLVIDNRIDAADERERQEKAAQVAEHELIGRLCAAWSNRVEDHALLVDYLDGFVGDDASSQEFVTGLRAAYARSDAAYARDRGLTEARCR